MKSDIGLKALKILWGQLGDMPINEDDEIEQVFHVPHIDFDIGTDKFEIWHWFDEKCPNNLHDDLMFQK